MYVWLCVMTISASNKRVTRPQAYIQNLRRISVPSTRKVRPEMLEKLGFSYISELGWNLVLWEHNSAKSNELQNLWKSPSVINPGVANNYAQRCTSTIFRIIRLLFFNGIRFPSRQRNSARSRVISSLLNLNNFDPNFLFCVDRRDLDRQRKLNTILSN